jgi:very-short-patch-repair endonuclease
VLERDRTRRLFVDSSRQRGLFTLEQGLAAQFSRATVRRRLESGAWEELAPRVYRIVTGDPPDWRTVTLARALSIGGAACRRSGLALHGLHPPPREPEVVVVRARRTGTRSPAPSTDSLSDVDLTVTDGIPCTTLARTLIDVAGLLARPAFEDLLDTAIVRRFVTVAQLRARAQELWAPRRNGCAIVLELLDARDPRLHQAANVWEAKVLRVVRELGLPSPEVNHRVRVGGRVRYLDVAWPDAKVAIEFDGFVPHSTRRVFDDDRARQNDLVADGWTVFRVTATMLRDPERTFAPIALAIAGKR